jgi:hypothetical protein
VCPSSGGAIPGGMFARWIICFEALNDSGSVIPILFVRELSIRKCVHF